MAGFASCVTDTAWNGAHPNPIEEADLTLRLRVLKPQRIPKAAQQRRQHAHPPRYPIGLEHRIITREERSKEWKLRLAVQYEADNSEQNFGLEP